MLFKVGRNVLIYYVSTVRYTTALTTNFHVYKCWDCINHKTGSLYCCRLVPVVSY